MTDGVALADTVSGTGQVPVELVSVSVEKTSADAVVALGVASGARRTDPAGRVSSG